MATKVAQAGFFELASLGIPDQMNVCLAEVIAFGQQRFPRDLSQSISATITQIQTGWVTALAESAVSGSGGFELLRSERNDFRIGSVQKQIQVPAANCALSRLNHDGRLQS